jgi:hypothetical protein
VWEEQVRFSLVLCPAAILASFRRHRSGARANLAS